MKHIDCINYISSNVPSILLIASLANEAPCYRHLKHFIHTHNIYVMYHNLDDNLCYYSKLTDSHNDILSELDKHSLKEFSICAISLGCFVAYYMMFYISQRVLRVYLHDFVYDNTQNLFVNSNNIQSGDWVISSCSIPVILRISSTATFVRYQDIIKLKTIFSNISFVFSLENHISTYKDQRSNFFKKFITKLLNDMSLEIFWDKFYPEWITGKQKLKPKSNIKILLYVIIRQFFVLKKKFIRTFKL